MKKLLTSILICMSATGAYALRVSDSIYIGPSNNVANLVMSTEDYDNWIQNDGFRTSTQPVTITKKLYQYFKDDFDVIMLITNEAKKPQTISYYGVNRPIANSVEGIGMSIYSNASYYGSAEKLFSLMYLPYMDAIKYGPTLHEFCHCWANYAIPTAVDGHWGICGGNTRGQLGGFKQSTLLTNVDGIANKYSAETFGTNANGGNGVPYNEFELYLMGMLPIESVQEFDAFPVVPSETFQYCDESKQRICFYADTRNHYTQASLINLLGQRVPNYTDSQKQFKALFVILSKEPLTSLEWTACESAIGWFCQTSDDGSSLYNFWEATGGVGSIDPSDLSSSLKNPTQIQTVDSDMQIDIHIMPSTIICSEPFHVFNMSGQDVTEQNGSLPYGIYIVHTTNGSHKVYVK
ncbi:MAG: hypothetical protein K5660_07210 [Paludibacteraceae bacterium]|nr:hypothetical protein [Paludibacteraceae bacterium]